MAVEYAGTGNEDGIIFGRATTDLIGFYGLATAIVQPSGATQAAITDASGGTAAATNGVLTLTGTYNSTIIANGLATVIALTNKLRADLVALNLIKGAA